MVANYELSVYGIRYLTADDFVFTYYQTIKKTVDTFNLESDDFESYLFVALKRNIAKEICSYLEESNDAPSMVSLDDSLEDGITYKDIIADDNEIGPARYYDLDDTRLYLSGKSRMYMSEEDLLKSKAITLKIFGFTMKEIAKKLNIPLSRIRRYLDKNDEPCKNIIIRLK